MRIRLIQNFLKTESSSGIVLLVAALFAMVLANSPYADSHHQFVSSSLFITNEGLMTLFFLVIGLELKRAYLDGFFSHRSQIILPVVAAIGGMIMPALIFILININSEATLRAWATPIATDIAFAVGVLSLFGKRIPNSLKLFLLSLAIFDDIGAIVVIALFYTANLSLLYLCLAAGLVIILFLFNHYRITILPFYLLIGVLLWLSLLKAGIHPTIAGIMLALFIPDNVNQSRSLLRKLENKLHPFVAYLVMPLFALVNAGFPVSNLTVSALTDVLVLGIAVGLFVGKQIGVFGFSWLLIRFKYAQLPEKVSWLALYGVALLCGIGFTMSLFLGTLSFPYENIYLAEVRLGVIIGSIFSGLFGIVILSLSARLTSPRGYIIEK